jgi:hypothetical protein
MSFARPNPFASVVRSLRSVLAIAVGIALVAACAGASLKTQVLGTWKDPKYASAPLKKVFVISLMKIEPGGRDAVEDAIVARLSSAGVAAVASHTVMSNDPQRPGPSLPEAIAAAGADGVLLVDVKAIGAYEPYTVGQTVTSLSPDTMASYKYLKEQGADQSGDYKVAHIISELYLPSMGKQVWTAFTNSYDASNLARNMPDYTFKLVTAMSKDRIIAGSPAPPS